ncbi:hypothetical protein SLS62_004818 [Diatrype stigma]|uniref:Uncharacterized protein n=1 Tax=Diatrype stigma TaxID=117547 RepID=A0AAN9V2H8_9PEZI
MRGLQRSRICSMLQPAVFRPSPGPYCRQFLRRNWSARGSGSGSVHGRSFHYQPNQGDIPVYFQDPKKPKSRIVRDMLLGSLLTITVSFAFALYRYQHVLQGISEVEAHAEAVAEEYEEFREMFARAHEAEDHGKLREATFAFVRSLCKKRDGSHGGEPFEAGPLPPYPEDDELRGKERIPAEDTLMIVETNDDDFITNVQVAVNLDLEDLEAVALYDDIENRRNKNPRQLADPTEDKLAELLSRFEWQVETWRQQDRLKGGRMLVTFALRNRLWVFTYAYDPWDSISVIALD